MLLQKLVREEFEPGYGLLQRHLYPWDDVVSPPFGSSWLLLEPGESTASNHNHHEAESFFVCRGRGVLTVDGETRRMESGDVVFLPPMSRHTVRNDSDEDLLFLSVYWEDVGLVAEHFDERRWPKETAAGPSLICTVPPGGLDPGAPGAAAAVHARFQRMRGRAVRLTDAGDDAGAAGPRLSADRFVADLVERLHARGKLTDVDGQLRLPLHPYAAELRRFHERVAMTPALTAYCERCLDDGLESWPVSRRSRRGIPVPVSGFEDQVIDEAVELAARYLRAAGSTDTAEPTSDRVRPEVVQFFGFDQAHTHAVLGPALWLAFDPDLRLPTALVTDGPRGGGGLLVPSPAAGVLEAAQSWLRGLGQRIETELGGERPVTGIYSRAQERFLGAVRMLIRRAEDSFDAGSFSPATAVRQIDELVRSSAGFAAEQNALAGVTARRDERRTAIALELLAARVLAMMVSPMQPALAERIASALGVEPPVYGSWESSPVFVPGGGPTRLADIELVETPA